MVFIKTIYPLRMRHFIFPCALFVMVGIICYLIFFDDEYENQFIDLRQYDNVITFWSNDFHIR